MCRALILESSQALPYSVPLEGRALASVLESYLPMSWGGGGGGLQAAGFRLALGRLRVGAQKHLMKGGSGGGGGKEGLEASISLSLSVKWV